MGFERPESSVLWPTGFCGRGFSPEAFCEKLSGLKPLPQESKFPSIPLLQRGEAGLRLALDDDQVAVAYQAGN